ncbi:nitroreductase family protein [Reyranella sp. CPCC 100927]|uniref:nitroreductase family protein n=1 Tax=Reyranella sp. CPCC 100927 TaxID=2599616 RepID=UPI0011B58B4E|nr:nitroreductase family protein [Reyranella sp. CPCC 100927]TWS95695.1 NADPH-dependent oxidoreductase [Reyranella sp. CPCC 100927]
MSGLGDLIERRFGERVEAEVPADSASTLHRMLARGVRRAFLDKPVEPALLRTLCAAALSSPTKSDMQQGDILILDDPTRRAAIFATMPDHPWLAASPVFLVFLGNNRRQRQIHDWRGKPFANDHLDPFFNAAVDGAIVMATFIAAAEAVGLGCCPISQIRNESRLVSDVLELPAHVFPIAGLAVGWPAREGELSLRLPLEVRVHHDRFDETDLAAKIDAYDRRRAAVQPYRRQRDEARFGRVDLYGWSEDKARQYARAERATFGDYVRGQGFKLD